MSSRSITPAPASFGFATARTDPMSGDLQPGGSLPAATAGMQLPARDRDVVGWEPGGTPEARPERGRPGQRAPGWVWA